MKQITSTISLAILSFLPKITYAKECGYVESGPDEGKLIPCGTGGLDSVSSIILKVTDWILNFGGAIAVLFIIFGGFQYLTAAGNEKQAETAKKTLTYAILGLIVILLSKVIVILVTNSLQGIADIKN